MFFINHTEIGESSSAIIEIEGPLNSDTTPDFDDYINNLVDNNIIYLLIDMLNLKFISSEGIGAVLMIQKNINDKNGLAVFFNMNYEIASLFKLLGFDKVFTIAADRADALNILDRHMELFPAGTPSREFSKIDGKENSFFMMNRQPRNPAYRNRRLLKYLNHLIYQKILNLLLNHS